MRWNRPDRPARRGPPPRIVIWAVLRMVTCGVLSQAQPGGADRGPTVQPACTVGLQVHISANSPISTNLADAKDPPGCVWWPCGTARPWWSAAAVTRTSTLVGPPTQTAC